MVPYPDSYRLPRLSQTERMDEEPTISGGILVAIVQGFLGGMAFCILGLPSPVLWEAVMTLLAFVPVVGPFLVWLPTACLLVIYHYVRLQIESPRDRGVGRLMTGMPPFNVCLVWIPPRREPRSAEKRQHLNRAFLSAYRFRHTRPLGPQ